MAPGPKRLAGIDVLRAVAIIAVLAAHLRVSSLATPHDGIAGSLAWLLTATGDWGVVLFFAISGFVIATTVIERDGALRRICIGAFYQRRVARIGPALALSIALGTVTMVLAPRDSGPARFAIFGDAPFSAPFWLSIGTFTFNFERVAAILSGRDWGLHWGVLWSLSVEEQFYLLFPLAAAFIRWDRGRLGRALAAVIFVAFFSRVAAQVWAPGIWLLPTTSCVDVLAIGVVAALCPSLRCPRARARAGASIGLFVVGAGFILGSLAPRFLAPLGGLLAPLVIAGGAALLMLCCKNGQVFTSRIWVPFARIGRVSYGMYLFHPLVLLCLSPLLRGMSFLPALALFIAAATAAAELSFALVEQPASRWIKARSAARLAPSGIESKK